MSEIARHWWLVALRGVGALGFGLVALGWPGVTLAVLVLSFGVYALVDGVSALGSAFFGGQAARGQRAWFILQGLAGIGAGIAALVWPGLNAVALLVIIAAWAAVVGVLLIALAVRTAREVEGEGWAILTGAMAVLLGVLLVVWPGTGALALTRLLGVNATAFGFTMLIDAGRLFRLSRRRRMALPAASQTPAAPA